MDVNFYCLHGFLGQAKDWDFLPKTWHTFSPELFRVPTALAPTQDMNAWAEVFNQWVLENKMGRRRKNVLIGYSLGGRLALHVLRAAPHLWEQVFIISSRFVIKSKEDRKKRQAADDQWSQRFLSEEWNTLIKSWNEQPALATTVSAPAREEEHFSRELLAAALHKWSVGRQDWDENEFKLYQEKLIWVTGGNGSVYSSLAEDLKPHWPHADFASVADSGHRIIFEKPAEIVSLIESRRG